MAGKVTYNFKYGDRVTVYNKKEGALHLGTVTGQEISALGTACYAVVLDKPIGEKYLFRMDDCLGFVYNKATPKAPMIRPTTSCDVETLRRRELADEIVKSVRRMPNTDITAAEMATLLDTVNKFIENKERKNV